MAFTYAEDLTIDRDWVRFKTGDTVEDESFLSDAIITSLLATEGSKEKAALAALDYIIRRLSQPNFRADWLQVDYKSAREGYERMRDELERELAQTSVGVDAVDTGRGDLVDGL